MTGVFIDGQPASVEALAALALANYGHFTTVQVRGGAARGLDLHLRRLVEATRELFVLETAASDLRRQLRLALQAGGRDDCTLRATVFAADSDPLRPGGSPAPRMLVAISPPLEPAAGPMRVRTTCYQRQAPHLKHVGTFPLIHSRRLAVRDGWDDAIFVDSGGKVLEGTTWNIGFIGDDGVTWPRGPALRGITERLLQAGLAEAGVAQATRVVDRDGLAGYRGAFACNSRGVRMIAAIDRVEYPGGPAEALNLAAALARAPWERI